MLPKLALASALALVLASTGSAQTISRAWAQAGERALEADRVPLERFFAQRNRGLYRPPEPHALHVAPRRAVVRRPPIVAPRLAADERYGIGRTLDRTFGSAERTALLVRQLPRSQRGREPRSQELGSVARQALLHRVPHAPPVRPRR
jgi:hypothetical protein